MKLLTHNMLTSNIIKGVTKGFPLAINPKRVEVQEVDFNAEFITRILPKLDFPALKLAASQVGHGEGLPPELPESVESSEETQKALHHVLLQVEVMEGELVCPETGRKFPIENGIPNMLLNEDEPKRVEVQEVDFNAEFITRILPKLDFPALKLAASQVGHGEGLPPELPESVESSEETQKALHHVLLQVEVMEGELVCPETGRKFPIENGIPNMLLNEDEVR